MTTLSLVYNEAVPNENHVRLGISQSARLEHRLIQSPQMIQAMQILQLSSLDLVERIEQEMLENPFLEEHEQRSENAEGEADGFTDGPEASPDSSPDADGVEGMMDLFERYERDFGDGRQRSGSGEDPDKKLEAMQNAPARAKGLGEALREHLPLLELPGRSRVLALYLIDSFDHRGYLPDSFEEIVHSVGVSNATVEDVSEALQELRRATHPALGARDLRECLLLQARAMKIEHPLVELLITEHLENITTNRLPRIARATDSTLDDVKEAIRTIQGFDPSPAREFGGELAETIHPDVLVDEIEGNFEVRLTRGGVPRLTISKAYRDVLAESKRGDSVRKWIKERLENARWFLDAIQQRESTLLRVSRVVFERQNRFLREGVRGLVPLRMVEVAEATEVHISTISRAVAGKYVQTPHGIFALRSFFSGGTETETGQMTSQASIQSRIKDLVDEEDGTKPLSDDRLAELLKERFGISIARRTVTKYRKALTIPSSTQRRKY